MKYFLSVVVFLLVPVLSVIAQITVDQSDMPHTGDTLRVSLTTQVPQGYAGSAMDTTWNFGSLQPLSQRVESYVNTAVTPSAYQFIFVVMGGANLASPLSAAALPGMPVSQGYSFFKNSSSGFSDLGFAYTLQGLPLPARYDNPDKQYQVPMVPGATWSSVSSFSLSMPGMGAYNTARNRMSTVDGWGTLTTPFGTFQTLRVKSNLVIHDSVHVDSLGSGYATDRSVTEYKWLAKGEGIPVLQINEEAGMATAIYRDIYRLPQQQISVTLGPDTSVLRGTVLTMQAEIAGGTPPYRIIWSTFDTGTMITVTVQNPQTYSVLVVDALQNVGSAQKVVAIRYPPGIEEEPRQISEIFPNPSAGMVTFQLPWNVDEARMFVYNALGQRVMLLRERVNAGQCQADLSGLPGGNYLVRFEAENRVTSFKVLITRN